MIKDIEQIIADKIASLTGTGGVKLFKTAQRWNNQITPGGMDSFERFSPFAFVKYLPGDVERAGGLDLVRNLTFGVTVGVHGQDCRMTAVDLLDAVISAIDQKHPAQLYVGSPEAIPTISCDILLATDESEILDNEKQYAISVIFEAKKI